MIRRAERVALRLDRGPAAGGWRTAAVCRVSLDALTLPGGLAAGGGKEPVAILLAREGLALAFAPDGRPLDEAEVDRLLPGGLAAFAAAG